MKQAASQMILATPPDRFRDAAVFGVPLAHMAYRIGTGPHLFRAKFPVLPRGGLMMIGDDGFDNRGDVQIFLREVMRECLSQNFTGIILDPSQAPAPLLARIITLLEDLTVRRGWRFYLPEAYADYSKIATIMISSAISGGSLRGRLRDAIARYGATRVAVVLKPISEDFYLPASTGSGTPITQEELHRRMDALSPSVFFSHDLCAHYFTYMDRNSGAHFILFDDAGSIRQKISISRKLGIQNFVLVYPEVETMLPEILQEST